MDRYEEFREQYELRLPGYRRFCDAVVHRLELLLSESTVEYYSIASRVKSFDALRLKFELRDLTSLPDDLVGVRVVCYYREDVNAAVRSVTTQFEVAESSAPEDTAYGGIHLKIRLPKAALALPEYAPFAGLSAECQIRTIVQHAHAEIEHALGYRAHDSMKRSAGRIEALAELYEQEVSRLRTELIGRNLSGGLRQESSVTAAEVHDRARSLKAVFMQLLEDASLEEELQSFLKIHPEFLYPEYVASHPKMKLGDDWVTDFVLRVNGTDGAEYVFIEIERPNKPVFVSNGQFSAEFTQAKDQLLNWERWVERNVAYLREKLPDLYRPQFHLIMSRSASITPELRDKLKSEFVGTPSRFSTYDDLLVRFETIESRVRSGA